MRRQGGGEDVPKEVGKPSHWMIQFDLARHPFLLT
jgi:hypothetical protein